MLTKAGLRAEMKSRLRAIGENEDRKSKANSALNHVVVDYLRSQSGTWAGFVPIPMEPNILPAIDESSHIRWVYPRVVENDLQFHVGHQRDFFAHNHLGIHEPTADAELVDVQAIDGFLVPGLAFDKTGARLGRGKGFYDRTLSQTPAQKVGVCFSLQLLDEGNVPSEEWDVSMNKIITERGLCSVTPTEEK